MTVVSVTTAWEQLNIQYVFNSRLKDSLRDNFGQTVVTAQLPLTGTLYKVNNFKPARASKFINTADGYEGSFCSDSSVKTLRDDGFSIKTKFFRPQGISGRAESELYYATINGLKIGYRLSKRLNMPTNFTTATGLTKATSGDIVFMGASFPRLGFVSYVGADGKKQVFGCDPDKFNSLPNGWKAERPPLHTAEHMIAILGV